MKNYGRIIIIGLLNWERKGLFRNASFKNTRLDCSKLLITATKGYHLQAFHDNKFRKMLNSEEAKNKIESLNRLEKIYCDTNQAMLRKAEIVL